MIIINDLAGCVEALWWTSLEQPLQILRFLEMRSLWQRQQMDSSQPEEDKMPSQGLVPAEPSRIVPGSTVTAANGQEWRKI